MCYDGLRARGFAVCCVVVGFTVTCVGAGPSTSSAPFQYTGPGGCSSTACHGSLQPRQDTRVAQNEYSIWVVQDKHAKAFSALTTPWSQRIARNLGMQQRPEAAQECLACHALAVKPEQRARTFDLNDGVSCENCHGPASGWLGEHTARNWTHQQSLQRGMYDTKDLARRDENCLSCHLGTAEKYVNHEMLAAGHPLLNFELDSYSAVMPRHWKEPLDKDPWRGVRAWSVGQAVQLREAMNQLGRWTKAPNWPEYAELDCYSCHHALTRTDDSWRQREGYVGRKPGTPPWDAAQYAVLRLMLGEINPAALRELDGELKQVSGAMNHLSPDRDKVNAAAQQCATTANSLVEPLKSFAYDQAVTVKLLHRIAADATPLSQQGERTAEQATMAIDSLYVAYTGNHDPANQKQVRAAIDALFQQLENPSAYNPTRFAEQLRRVGELLP